MKTNEMREMTHAELDQRLAELEKVNYLIYVFN